MLNILLLMEKESLLVGSRALRARVQNLLNEL